jgi:hypothetical protein
MRPATASACTPDLRNETSYASQLIDRVNASLYEYIQNVTPFGRTCQPGTTQTLMAPRTTPPSVTRQLLPRRVPPLPPPTTTPAAFSIGLMTAVKSGSTSSSRMMASHKRPIASATSPGDHDRRRLRRGAVRFLQYARAGAAHETSVILFRLFWSLSPHSFFALRHRS